MSAIDHIFVLMLENRSFDHMLGFSQITGTDAETGQPTQIDGLTGTESNSYGGRTYPVSPSAPFTMRTDPGHEFSDVVIQLAGAGGSFPPGGPYPSVDCSGFAADFAAAGGSDPGQVLMCFDPDNLPVLTALCREFAVCDRWFSSMPGPTWPNRLFAAAASSSGLDHSPRVDEITRWETVQGFSFRNGTIFDRLKQHGLPFRLYGDWITITGALKGISPTYIHGLSTFSGDVAQPSYPAAYTFIEPDYGSFWSNYLGGTSQHPLDDVRGGEQIIKSTYEALRASPLWDRSMLIITWDEHGGFYDHVRPGSAQAPGDEVHTPHNRNGFGFDVYGVRVPAVVVAPRIPRNVVDHRIYDHTSILATVEHAFGLTPLTARDAAARPLLDLASLSTARPDTPTTLPEPAGPALAAPAALGALSQPVHPDADVDGSNLAGFIHVALRQDLTVTPPEEREARVARARAITTREEARNYLEEVRQRVRAAAISVRPPDEH
ncbi:MAG: alkaline phosphatase family protein [Pseudonocardiaceae bacterium]